ncbi:MFS transporter [archaeon]
MDAEKLSKNISKIYAFSFLWHLHFMAGVLIPFFTLWGKISFTEIMLLQSFFVVSVFLLEIPTGAVADRFGRKTSLILSSLVSMVGVIVYSSYPSIAVFALGEFIFAIGSSLISGADEALMYDTLKKTGRVRESKKILPRMHSFRILGVMVGAPIGGIIGYYLGLQYAVMLMAIPMALSALVAWTLEEPKTRKSKESTRYIDTLISGVTYFRKHKILRKLAADEITIGAVIFFIIWLYQPALQSAGVAIIWFGFVHALIAVAQIVFQNNFERLEKFFGKKGYIKYSAIIPGICFILLALGVGAWAMVGLITLIAAFGLSRRALYANYYNKHIESKNRATVLSTIRMVGSFVRALLYPLVGVMVDFSLPLALGAIGVVLVAAALLSRVEDYMLVD